MNERKISSEEFQLTVYAADAALGRTVALPQELADDMGTERFVEQSKFAGLVSVEREGDKTYLKQSPGKSTSDFRFGESVTSDIRKNRMSASGQRVKSE